MTPLILCARVPWPVPAVRYGERKCASPKNCGSDGETCCRPGCDWFACSHCGARVKVVA